MRDAETTPKGLMTHTLIRHEAPIEKLSFEATRPSKSGCIQSFLALADVSLTTALPTEEPVRVLPAIPALTFPDLRGRGLGTRLQQRGLGRQPKFPLQPDNALPRWVPTVCQK